MSDEPSAAIMPVAFHETLPDAGCLMVDSEEVGYYASHQAEVYHLDRHACQFLACVGFRLVTCR